MGQQIGDQFSKYRLIRLLGTGGFAEVWLGKHESDQREAAIKVLNVQLPTVAEQDEFLNEARHLGRLVHPHIVRLLDCGIQGDKPYLILEYAPSGTLRQRHPKGSKLPTDLVTRYIKQITEGLQYAHNSRIIHRDIKPENMLLDNKNDILLGDFGIALPGQTLPYPKTQNVMGTTGYMAPEQLEGHPALSSDQYSLAVIVYEWLSGSLPFRGAVWDIRKQQQSPPPSLLNKVPGLPLAVEQVIFKALSEDVSGRFRRVQDFADALEQAVNNPKGAFHLPPSNNPFVGASPQSPIPQSPNGPSMLDPTLNVRNVPGINNIPAANNMASPVNIPGVTNTPGANNISSPTNNTPGTSNTPIGGNPAGTSNIAGGGLQPGVGNPLVGNKAGSNTPLPPTNSVTNTPPNINMPPNSPLNASPAGGFNSPPLNNQPINNMPPYNQLANNMPPTNQPQGQVVLPGPGAGGNGTFNQFAAGGSPFIGVPPAGSNNQQTSLHAGPTIPAQPPLGQSPFTPYQPYQPMGQTHVSGPQIQSNWFAQWFDRNFMKQSKNQFFLYGGGIVDFLLAVALGFWLNAGNLSWNLWLGSFVVTWLVRALCAGVKPKAKYVAFFLASLLSFYWFVGSWALGTIFQNAIKFEPVPPHIIALLVGFAGLVLHLRYVIDKKR